MARWAAVVLGSAAGGALRFLVAGALTRRFGPAFPWGTLAVNLLGCLAIGWVAGRGGRFSEETRLLLATGFCGGFTTFSAFALEMSGMPGVWRPSAYALLSVAGGLAVFRTGFLLAR